ncbi:MAG: hypothetical protein ACK559_40095, partial [bacterium]
MISASTLPLRVRLLTYPYSGAVLIGVALLWRLDWVAAVVQTAAPITRVARAANLLQPLPRVVVGARRHGRHGLHLDGRHQQVAPEPGLLLRVARQAHDPVVAEVVVVGANQVERDRPEAVGPRLRRQDRHRGEAAVGEVAGHRGRAVDLRLVLVVDDLDAIGREPHRVQPPRDVDGLAAGPLLGGDLDGAAVEGAVAVERRARLQRVPLGRRDQVEPGALAAGADDADQLALDLDGVVFGQLARAEVAVEHAEHVDQFAAPRGVALARRPQRGHGRG